MGVELRQMYKAIESVATGKYFKLVEVDDKYAYIKIHVAEKYSNDPMNYLFDLELQNGELLTANVPAPNQSVVLYISNNGTSIYYESEHLGNTSDPQNTTILDTEIHIKTEVIYGTIKSFLTKFDESQLSGNENQFECIKLLQGSTDFRGQNDADSGGVSIKKLAIFGTTDPEAYIYIDPTNNSEIDVSGYTSEELEYALNNNLLTKVYVQAKDDPYSPLLVMKNLDPTSNNYVTIREFIHDVNDTDYVYDHNDFPNDIERDGIAAGRSKVEVGGMKRGLKLDGKSALKILSIIAGNTPIPKTPSTINITVNKKDGTTFAENGDTFTLSTNNAMTITLTEGTDFNDLTSVVIKCGNDILKTLNETQLNTLKKGSISFNSSDFTTTSWTLDSSYSSVGRSLTWSVDAEYEEIYLDEDYEEQIRNGNLSKSTTKSVRGDTSFCTYYYGAIPETTTVGTKIGFSGETITIETASGTIGLKQPNDDSNEHTITYDATNNSGVIVKLGGTLTSLNNRTGSLLDDYSKDSGNVTLTFTRNNSSSYSKTFYYYHSDDHNPGDEIVTWN